MTKLPVFKTLFGSLNRTFLNGSDLFLLTLKYFLAFIVSILITLGLIDLSLPQDFWLHAQNPYRPFDFLEIMGSRIWPFAGSLLLGLTLLASFILNFGRLIPIKVVHPDDESSFFLSAFGMKNFIYALKLLKFFFAMLLIFIVAGIFWAILVLIRDALNVSHGFVVFGSVIIGLVTTYIFLRLFLFSTAAALGKKSPFKESWHLTKGSVLRIIALCLLYVLTFIVIFIIPLFFVYQLMISRESLTNGSLPLILMAVEFAIGILMTYFNVLVYEVMKAKVYKTLDH